MGEPDVADAYRVGLVDTGRCRSDSAGGVGLRCDRKKGRLGAPKAITDYGPADAGPPIYAGGCRPGTVVVAAGGYEDTEYPAGVAQNMPNAGLHDLSTKLVPRTRRRGPAPRTHLGGAARSPRDCRWLARDCPVCHGGWWTRPATLMRFPNCGHRFRTGATLMPVSELGCEA